MTTRSGLTLGWKLAGGATLATGAVLAISVAIVSLMTWRSQQKDAHGILHNAAHAPAALIDAYDEAARKAAARDMRLLKNSLRGTFSLADAPDAQNQPVLLHDGQPLNGAFERLDAFTDASGAVATVFVRSGDDFLRATTSLKKQDGSRAVGTLLGAQHPAHRLLLDGKPYIGRATLFGTPYMTQYEPIVAQGRTIGVLFIGSDMTDTLASLRRAMQAQRLAGDGAVYAIEPANGGSAQVFGLAQPQRLDTAAAPQAAFADALAQAAKAQSDGQLVADWSPLLAPGAEQERQLAFARNDAWQWIVVADVSSADFSAPARGILTALWGAVAAAIAVLVLVMAWISRRLVSRPVHALGESLRQIAAGDLRQPLHAVSSDELGDLARTMEGFRVQLAHTLAGVRAGADNVANASTEIAQGNADLSSRTEAQASALEETAASMEQLGSTVRHNADNARQADQLAQRAPTLASESGQAVTALVDTMKSINDGSHRIADIVGVIDSLAFQTNILALNAAVEAARAGEQGRGFAVVASEVRSLAQRSAEAAKEIKQLIDSSVAQVEQGSAAADRAGVTVGEAVAAIQRVSGIVGEISAASAEQSSGVSQVGEAVTQMDQATQQNAALVEQSAAAAASLKSQAEQLVEAVAVFRIAEDGAAGAAPSPAASPARPPAVLPAGSARRHADLRIGVGG